MAKDFNRNLSGQEITEAIAGKKVIGFGDVSDAMDDLIIFKFSDGTELRLRYDWIYEWELCPLQVSDEP